MGLISPELIKFDCGVSYRDEAIKIMADMMEASGKLDDKEQYIKDVLDRESESTTAVGYAIAVPHAKSAGVKEACVGFMKFTHPIQWDANSKPIAMAFQIAVPKDAGNQHLEILGQIFRSLLHEDFRSRLAKASTTEEAINLIKEI